MSLLGIDIGSGSVKAVAFASDGSILAQATADYPTTYRENGHVEAMEE